MSAASENILNADPIFYSVLVVDDDEFMHAIMKVSLRNANYLTTFAHNGADAMRMIKQNPPDIVITDCLMPVVSGFELIEEIKNDPATAGIPVIVLTALEDPNEMTIDSTRKADFWLTKPFRVGSILDCLKKAEELVQANRNLRAQAMIPDMRKYFIRWRLK